MWHPFTKEAKQEVQLALGTIFYGGKICGLDKSGFYLQVMVDQSKLSVTYLQERSHDSKQWGQD